MHLQPRPASFAEALEIIQSERLEVEKCLVALDQPTIVPNFTGSRPVDKVAGSIISWIGGGVQPANRSKLGMFDDAAPIWEFKRALRATEDPEQARAASEGLFIIEVFPALALATIEQAFCKRLGAPKYNPVNRKQFRLEDWRLVAEAIRNFGALSAINQLDQWCAAVTTLGAPKKADQDKVDAVICGLIGLHWLKAPRKQSIMIGDLDHGYMITPAINGVHERLSAAATARNVPIS